MLDEFLNVQATLPRGGQRWWWHTVDLTDDQRAAVVEALHRPDVSDKAVHIVLSRWGVKVTHSQVSHLRRRLTNV
jgi:transposase